tara:strand:- start:1953 stop:2750 length:798 start_codon:yes stop_codon:yes gene_type:complete
MADADLVWEVAIFDDPDGGRIVVWPHLPCVRMSNELRTREHWDGLGLIASEEDIAIWPEEEKQERESPGVHVSAAHASGTVLGRLMDDLITLEIEGPSIPDPEPLRLLHHAKNARGGMPIFPIEPSMEDDDWIDWLTRAADAQVTMGSLLSRITVSRRWKKRRKLATPRVAKNRGVSIDMGAASVSSAAWWEEECSGLTDALIEERALRMASRIRGALSSMRESRVDDSSIGGPSLLVPVHQPRMSTLVDAIMAWPDAESIDPVK